jgi:phosphatidylglycerophosphate synthase
MISNQKFNPKLESKFIIVIKENLADFLTFSRAIIGFVILTLSLGGKNAYIVVVILSLVGGATDMFDGKVARRYLKGKTDRLGKYDLEIDTFFVLSIILFISISEIVVPKAVGLGWVGLAIIAITLSKGKTQILIFFEAVSVISLLIITGLYDLRLFTLIIAPIFMTGVLINYKRVLYIVFNYWPRLYSNWHQNIKP